MERYDIIEWSEYFEKSKSSVDPKQDFLESRSKILYPGRFYVLNYMSKTKERFNTRPVIISMGVSKKYPDSFLCIDLSVIPKKARLQFVDMFFKIFNADIMKNMEKYFFTEDADKQGWFRNFTYENICKAVPMLPVKYAIKRYKIENVRKIYSLPFSNVYKIIGDYCDENYYMNGTIADAQKEFLLKMRK